MDAPMHHRHPALQRLLGNRRLLAIVLAGGLSSAGDWLYLTALPILLFVRSGDLGLVGLVAAIRLLPFLFLSIPAGALVDRVGPRRVLLVSEAIRGLAMAMAALVVVIEAPLPWLVGIAVIAAVAGTVSMPAQGAFLPILARDDEELALANSADATLEGVASVAGPAVAAILVILGGVAFAFALNAATFAIVVLAVSRAGDGHVRSNQPDAGADPETGSQDPGVMDVLRRIRRPLALDAAVSLTAGALTVLPIAIVAESLHGEPSMAGGLALASGIGALAGGLGSAAFAGRGARTGMLVGVVTTSFAVLAMGAGSLPMAIGAMAACGGSLVLLDTLGRTWLQRITATGGTGRAFGLLNSLAAIWMLVGSIAPAMLVPRLGLGPVLAVGAVVILAAGAVALAPRPRPGLAVGRAAAAG